MKIKVRVSQSFKRQAKPLLKKYTSLKEELAHLENVLVINPHLGHPLGKESYKIKLAVKSKGKGKSGGLRVISHIDAEVIGLVEPEGDAVVVTLISIYDKSETATISVKELQDLIASLKHEK